MQVYVPDTDGLTTEFAKIDDLVTPFAHLDPAILVDGLGSLLPDVFVRGQVIEALVLVLLLVQHDLHPILDLQIDLVMFRQNGVLQFGRR